MNDMNYETTYIGEVWHGKDAVTRGLVDEIKTYEDILLDILREHNQQVDILQIKYKGTIVLFM